MLLRREHGARGEACTEQDALQGRGAKERPDQLQVQPARDNEGQRHTRTTRHPVNLGEAPAFQ